LLMKDTADAVRTEKHKQGKQQGKICYSMLINNLYHQGFSLLEDEDIENTDHHPIPLLPFLDSEQQTILSDTTPATATATATPTNSTTVTDHHWKSCQQSNCLRKSKKGCRFNACKVCCERLSSEHPQDEEEEEMLCKAHQTKVLKQQQHQYQHQQQQQVLVEGEEVVFARDDSIHSEKEINDNNNHHHHYIRHIKKHTNKNQKNTNLNEEDEASTILSSSALPIPYPYRSESYQAHCRVLLIGIGADEQLAGYARHRTVFIKDGWQGLLDEMNRDLTRLWQRNLGR
jgi:hypothetical protein